MPNLLAHIGAQGFVTQGIMRGADPKWILAGCILPDVPWIVNRILEPVMPAGLSFDARLYFIAQSSLFITCILAVALALFSTRPARVLAIMMLGAVLHLLLDATQTKWGNGVHLFAPFSWEVLNFGLYWPEDAPSHLLTGLGIAYFVYACWHFPAPMWDLRVPRPPMAMAAAACVLAYGLLPLAFQAGPYAADNLSIRTLSERESRIGKPVSFDRSTVTRSGEDVLIRTLGGEHLTLIVPEPLDEGAVLSIRGKFLDSQTVKVERFHEHAGRVRDYWSYLGLLLIAGYWLSSLVRSRAKGGARSFTGKR